MGEQFASFGDIYKADIDGTCVYVTRDPGHAEHVLRCNWRNYVKGQAIKRVALLLGKGLMVSEGELWKCQRRMVQPSLHGRVIEASTSWMIRENTALLESWENAARRAETVNVTTAISQLVLKGTLLSIFGEDYEEVWPHFNILSEDADRSLEFAQAFRALGQIVLQVANRRRQNNLVSNDILGMLMESRDRDTDLPMPDGRLVNEVLTLVVAGHETTASTLNWTWYLLSQHRDVEKKLSSELDRVCEGELSSINSLKGFPYTRQVLDETLRLYPAGWLMTRRALRDDQLGDYFVPAGTEIYIPPYFIQRHPRLWVEPDRFNPDRFAPEQREERHCLSALPFSAGPRNCIGEAFARVEMQIHLMIIARRLRFVYSETREPELAIGVNLRSKDSFIMLPEIKESPVSGPLRTWRSPGRALPNGAVLFQQF